MTILQSLNARYRRLADRGELPAYGYSTERVAFIIVLSAAGEPTAVLPWQVPAGKKMEPRPTAAPQSFKRPGVTPRAFFLWDNSKFVLGVGIDKTAKGQAAKGQAASYPGHFAAFRDLHHQLIGDDDDAGLQALLRFVDGWTEARFQSAPFSADMLEANIAFMLDGDCNEQGAPRLLHDRPAARRIWERQMATSAGDVGLCLVTGETAPVARLHPAIKGVMNAQSSGASLVSFNNDAFTSYGKEQGANAPVSEMAAFGYGAALNAMLARDSGNRVQIADATTVFWADAAAVSADPAMDAAWAEAFVAAALDPPPDPPSDPPSDLLAEEAGEKIDGQTGRAQIVDAQNARRLRDALLQVAQGRPLREIDPRLDPDARFSVLGLAPNIARLSIRFWLQDSFGNLADNFRRHWADARIAPWPWKTAQPSIKALLVETAMMRKFDNIPNQLTGEMMRAVLTGGRYPRTLLSATVMRMRADQEISGRRAAICRAVIVRDLRLDNKLPADKKEDYLVSLDREETNAGYRLGRLFAVLENAQRAALGRVNATIRDRYYGAASATPAAVFPLLLRTGAHHLAVLRKGDKGGLSVWFDKEIGDILGEIGTVFPRSLSIEDQGRFAIGYYHQRATAKSGGADAETAQSAETVSAEAEG